MRVVVLGGAAISLSRAPADLKGWSKCQVNTYVLRECKRRKITTETFLGEGRLIPRFQSVITGEMTLAESD